MASPSLLRVMEFYAGVGGFHWALKKAGVEAEIVASVDINTNTNSVYAHNFPTTPHLNRNICGMTAKELDGYRPDVFVLSPPCQPFTRQGLRRDNQDTRTDSFFHLMTLLGEMKAPPRYLLMENVQGFETSQTREHFVGILDRLGYTVQEFLLSPSQFGIPNSRLRFYLLAKRKPLRFAPIKLEHGVEADDDGLKSSSSSSSTETENVKRSVDLSVKSESVDDGSLRSPSSNLCTNAECLRKFVPKECQISAISEPNCSEASPISTKPYGATVSYYLLSLSDDELSSLLVSDKILRKYAIAMDIVQPNSDHSCCFTKAYGNYALGTGSILQHSLGIDDLTMAFEEYSKLQGEPDKNDKAVECLRKLNLRYFSPKEVANLMCFPEEFCFPSSLSRNQCYKVMGNSLNVYVVSVLMTYLFCDSY